MGNIQTNSTYTPSWAQMGPQKYFYIRYSNSYNILTRIVKHQVEFHGEALESTFLEILETQLGTALIKSALLDLSLSRELD